MLALLAMQLTQRDWLRDEAFMTFSKFPKKQKHNLILDNNKLVLVMPMLDVAVFVVTPLLAGRIRALDLL